MVLNLVTGILLGCLAAGCATGSGVDSRIAAARTDAEVIHRASNAPALAVAVVANGKIVWTDAFGVADVASGTPATAGSEFRVGSVTKLITATLLARLAEHDVVDLDDPVARYVPEFKDERVTLRQLAMHLGGIRHYGRSEYINSKHYSSVAESLEKFIHDPLIVAPGTKYLYSSYGYNLLGAALENAAHLKFADLVSREVLTPFGMRHTFVDGSLPADSSVVTFYDRGDDGKPVAAAKIDLSDRIPSGGYISTAADLARFAQGTVSLPPDVQSRLFESGRTEDGKETKVGLGWRLATDEAGRRYVHHGGDTIGGRCFILLYPREKVAVVLLANMSFATLGEAEARRVASHFLPE